MKFYIEYLSKANNFRQTRKEFGNQEKAANWAKRNLPNFHPDMIKVEF